jgi:hypothetical protein
MIDNKIIENYRITIDYEENPLNPREYMDNLGIMFCKHRKYSIGDKNPFTDFDSWKELEEMIINEYKPIFISPLYLMDHSQVSLSMDTLNDLWDFGQIGYVFVTKETMENVGLIDKGSIEDSLSKELDIYTNYLNGYVYEYKIEKIEKCNLGHEHYTHVTSSGGYNERNLCMEDAESECYQLSKPNNRKN